MAGIGSKCQVRLAESSAILGIPATWVDAVVSDVWSGGDHITYYVEGRPGEKFSISQGNIRFDRGAKPAPQKQAMVTPDSMATPDPSVDLPRLTILRKASSLISGDREAAYGPPKRNLTCAGELKAVFRKWLEKSERKITPGELEALDMVMTKLGRLATGSGQLDTYVDGAAYFALAGELNDSTGV